MAESQINTQRNVPTEAPFFMAVASNELSTQMAIGDQARAKAVDGYEGRGLYALRLDGQLTIRRVVRQAGGVMLVSRDHEGAPVTQMHWNDFEEAVVGRIVAVVRDVYSGGLH
ncbi:MULTISPECIES: hypothetical protein [Hyphobacterium]|uniref:Peptidase S24/S26A/S26B/S26C domain-containing protein n=1 Tax=Hyphobacterium vulgare TaxID=1736751 RepID=A0ABV6ZU68_9PROT